MVDIPIRISVDAPGARATSNEIRDVGSNAALATVAVAGLVAVLAAVTARGLIGIASDAVQVSAQFQRLEQDLQGVLGSQEAANSALDTFIDLSTRTPFAVGEIVSGAQALGSVARGNQRRLEELTETAANLAAVTGLSFDQTSQNLARALSGGIRTAEAFRRQGVGQIIEAVQQIPDATRLSAQQTEEALLAVFGPGGRLGNAAAALNNTLDGAAAGIETVFRDIQRSIGDAFSPVLIQTARRVVIPFLQRLRDIAVENQAALRDLAVTFIPLVLRGLISLAEAALEAARFLGQFLGTVGEIRVSAAEQQLRRLRQERNQAAIELRRLRTQIGDGDPTDRQARIISGAQERLERFSNAAREQEETLASLREGQDDFASGFASLERGIDSARAELESFRNVVNTTDFGDPGETPEIDVPETTGGREEELSQRNEIEAAERRILQIRDRARIAAAQQIEPLDAQKERLEQQLDLLERQVAVAGESDQSREARALIEGQILNVEREKNTLLEDQARLETEIASLIDQIAVSSPELANQLSAAALAAVEAGGGLEDIVRKLQQLRGEGASTLQREQQRTRRIGEQIGQTLAGGISSTLRTTLDGEAVSFGEKLAETSSNLLELALTQVLNSVSKKFGELLQDSGGGTGFGTAVAAGLGGALALVAGAVRDTSAEISNGLATSPAIESVQATRGIVAGPQNIPILAVGESLEEAIEPLITLVAELRDIGRAALGGATGGSLPDPADELQATNSLV